MTKHIIQKLDNKLASTHPETARLISFGVSRGWTLVILGQAPMLQEPIRLKEWLLVPAHEDTSQIPPRALNRVRALYAVGIRPRGFVIVHEAPMALPAGETAQKINPLPIGNIEFEDAAANIGKAIGALAAFAVAATGIALMSGLAVGAVMLDPILIAVTQDNYWIEIDRWNA
jgi:hypothetical protein